MLRDAEVHAEAHAKACAYAKCGCRPTKGRLLSAEQAVENGGPRAPFANRHLLRCAANLH